MAYDDWFFSLNILEILGTNNTDILSIIYFDRFNSKLNVVIHLTEIVKYDNDSLPPWDFKNKIIK